MQQKITRDLDTNELVIEQRVPLTALRSNPWDEDYKPEMDNIVGHIAGDEMGFAYWIDMDYKGTPDQVSVLWWLYNGGRKDFKKLCARLNIAVQEEPICVKCCKVVYGTHGWDNGPVCQDH